MKYIFFVLFWAIPVFVGYAFNTYSTAVAVGIAVPAMTYWVGCLLHLAKDES